MAENKNLCRIAIDVMGGDNAPFNEIKGAVDAHKEVGGFELILVGKEDEIKEVARHKNISLDGVQIVNATEVIRMNETPTVALKQKKDSSLVVGANLVKNGDADAFVSAGNTGAMMAASTLLIGRIKGVGRPTIGAPLPTINDKPCVVYDAGASVDSKPQHLLEYAMMADIYAKEIMGNKNPTIALLNVGEEEKKGNNLVLEAAKLLKESNLNFIGNVEGRDILMGKADIVLCDGFVGNILLKFGESFLSLLREKLRSHASKSLMNKIKVGLFKNTLKAALSDLDYQKHGGVPLLGIDGISIIGHGSSSPLAIKNMVLRAKEMHEKGLIQKFRENFS
ncbi:MAG: phosphate acyltransferase PlsX [Ignavibacteria bacterium]|nr:MAG: phosphate acyltransferase PlsX [Ignavibacteria bacterium]